MRGRELYNTVADRGSSLYPLPSGAVRLKAHCKLPNADKSK